MTLRDKAAPLLRMVAWFYLVVMLPLLVLIRLLSELPAERRDMLDLHIMLCVFIVMLAKGNGLYKKRM